MTATTLGNGKNIPIRRSLLALLLVAALPEPGITRSEAYCLLGSWEEDTGKGYYELAFLEGGKFSASWRPYTAGNDRMLFTGEWAVSDSWWWQDRELILQIERGRNASNVTRVLDLTHGQRTKLVQSDWVLELAYEINDRRKGEVIYLEDLNWFQKWIREQRPDGTWLYFTEEKQFRKNFGTPCD